MINNMNIKGEWVWRVVMSAIAGYIFWTVQSSYSEQKAFNSDIHRRVSSLEIEAASAFGSRVTMGDFSSLDKRVTRAEDAVVALKEYLPRIERKLDELTNRQ